MLIAAARRFAYLIALASAVTLAIGGLLALAMGSSWQRAISIGFYGIGCFLLLAGFFVGNRGPARLKNEDDAPPLLMPFFGTRTLRWATADEQGTTINDSAIFVALGLVLIMIGAVVDTRYDLF